MEFLIGAGIALYSIGILFGVLFFCLHIGLEPSRLPFALRLAVAILAALLWPLGFGLYRPFMGWKQRRDRSSFEAEQDRWEADRSVG